ncbi:hypothetical protein AB0T83_15000 [Fluviibacterium sp. DFM31]|uniref:Uncharacterized protein n=1 Tax=Meridianimarinicoccus marinus TaxID=3231483 RepID=A0ABV3L9A4_9RHOB
MAIIACWRMPPKNSNERRSSALFGLGFLSCARASAGFGLVHVAMQANRLAAQFQRRQLDGAGLVRREQDPPAVDDAGTRHHVQDRARRHRLAQSAFADDAGGLAAEPVEVDTVQDIEHARRG